MEDRGGVIRLWLKGLNAFVIWVWMSLFIQIYEIVEIILCELVGRVEFLYYLNIFSKSSFLTTHDLEGICIIKLQIKKL